MLFCQHPGEDPQEGAKKPDAADYFINMWNKCPLLCFFHYWVLIAGTNFRLQTLSDS